MLDFGLTGKNAIVCASSKGLGLEGVEGLYLAVLANCKASPDASFISAIINLYAELKK